MKKSTYIVFFLLFTVSVKAQFNFSDTVWTISGYQKLTERQNRIVPDISFDARQSFYQKQAVKVGGFRIGVNWQHVNSFGIGFYFLNNRVFDYDFHYDIPENKIEYALSYSSLYYERILFFNRKWEISSAMYIGSGSVKVFRNPGGGNNRIRFDKIPISPTELNAKVTYNIFYWLSAGVGGGYRANIGATEDLRKSFNSPTYVLNINVKVLKLLRSYFDNSVKDEY